MNYEKILIKQDKEIQKLESKNKHLLDQLYNALKMYDEVDNILHKIKKECNATLRTDYNLDKEFADGMKAEAKEILNILQKEG